MVAPTRNLSIFFVKVGANADLGRRIFRQTHVGRIIDEAAEKIQPNRRAAAAGSHLWTSKNNSQKLGTLLRFSSSRVALKEKAASPLQPLPA